MLDLDELAKDPQRLRTLLIETAGKLFAKSGYNEITVRNITEIAGVDVHSFYYLFKSKEELLECVALNMADDLIDGYKQILDGPGSPVEKLTEMVKRLLSSKQRRANMIGLMKKKTTNVRYLFRRYVLDHAGPIVSDLIEEGIALKQMNVPYPKQIAEVFIHTILYTMDLMENDDKEEASMKIKAVVYMMEVSLGLRPGTVSNSLAL